MTMFRVYPDTNFFVYYLQWNPSFSPVANLAFDRLRQTESQICSSLFVLSELLVLPTRMDDLLSVAQIRTLFRSPQIVMLPYTAECVTVYANLRGLYRVKAMDALHLACAAVAGVDLFMTNDTRLQSLIVPGIGRIAGIDATF